METVYKQITEQIKAYFKASGFQKTVIALSGGIDSAVVVALAVEALGKENVIVLLLPSQFSSGHSVDDSVEMANRLDIEQYTIPIAPIFDAAVASLESVFRDTESGLAEENMQSRTRMLLTMAVANKRAALMLNTSNKSEIMVGYGTLYGDTSGAMGVIADLYKLEVYALARYINEVQGNTIPENIITKPPSAELRPDQFDTDSLPDYCVLDKVLYRLVDLQMTQNEIIEEGFEPEAVAKIVQLNKNSIFKRAQLPPAIKLNTDHPLCK